MDQYVYWHAPLWEVLLLVSIGLVAMAWLIVRLIRRPHLSAVHPALNEQPGFSL